MTVSASRHQQMESVVWTVKDENSSWAVKGTPHQWWIVRSRIAFSQMNSVAARPAEASRCGRCRARPGSEPCTDRYQQARLTRTSSVEKSSGFNNGR